MVFFGWIRREIWLKKQLPAIVRMIFLPYLIENEVPIGVWIPCANARQVDETKFYANMSMDTGGTMIDLDYRIWAL